MHVRPILMISSVLFLIKFMELPLSLSVVSFKIFVISMLSFTRRPSSTSVQHCTKPMFILKIGFKRYPNRSQKRFSSKKKKLHMIRISVSMTARIQNNNSGKVLYLRYLIRQAQILCIAVNNCNMKRVVVMYITATSTFSSVLSTIPLFSMKSQPGTGCIFLILLQTI